MRPALRNYETRAIPAFASEPYAPLLSDYHDSTDEQTLSGAVKRHNSFARLKLITSGTSLRIGYVADFASNAWLTIFTNGAPQTVTLTADGSAHTVDVTLPSGSTKVIDIWEGPQFGYYEPSIQSGGVVTSLEVLDGQFYMMAATRPTRRVIVYGDSISQGYPVVPASSYIGLIRQSKFDGGISSYGSGGRSIYEDKTQQTLAVVASILSAGLALVQPGGRQDLLVAIGTNDWGQALDGGVANYQTSVATLVDLVHTSAPSAKVHLVSPIVRSGEATPNAQGNTLAQYRTAMSTVASTRGPWCTYHDASTVLTLGELSDGVHPNASGYATLASYFAGLLA